MFQNISAPLQYESISDYGARRVLGMGGSLMGYIQTGNAYDKRYYHKAPCRDAFNRCNTKKKINKIVTALIACAGIVGGALLFAKGKGINFIDKIPKIKLGKIDLKNFKVKNILHKNPTCALFGKYSAKTKQQSGLTKLWLDTKKFNLPKNDAI